MSEYVFKLPDLGEGTVESEISEWNVKVGDEVAEEDIVGTMMTDKAAIDVSAPVSGRIVSLAGEPGDVIAVGAALIVFEVGDAAADEALPAAQPAAADTPPEPAAAAIPEATTNASAHLPRGRARVATSPAIRRRAKEAGIDLTAVPGSGSGGRILRADFDRYVHQRSAEAVAPARSGPSGTTEVKIIGLRRVIAERMTAAKREIPHFSYVEELDITELESLRKHLNDSNDASATRLTLLPFLGLALIRVLRDFPQCNTTHDRARNVLIRHEGVHLGVATQTRDGLKVPVVRNAERHSLEGLANEIRRVSDAARNNTIKASELSGSTITITSLGKLGGIASTPVINMPEVAIIGVNKAVQRPVVLDGQIAVRLVMNLSSSFDHRFVDGYDAAAMIQRIKDLLEHPATIFLPS